MAGVLGSLGISGVSVATGATKTILQLVAPANHRLLVRAYTISFNGVTNADPPILVKVLRQTTAGTMTSLTPVKNGDYGETLQASGSHTATVEPTDGDVLQLLYVHPQTGAKVMRPGGQPIIVPGGGRLAIKVVAGTMTGLSCSAEFEYEE